MKLLSYVRSSDKTGPDTSKTRSQTPFFTAYQLLAFPGDVLVHQRTASQILGELKAFVEGWPWRSVVGVAGFRYRLTIGINVAIP